MELLCGKEKLIRIRQATSLGYAVMREGGVADLSYPKSKTRRARVQGSGDICPTITAETSELYLIWWSDVEENKPMA